MNKFKKFMEGRYGADELNLFLITLALIFKILASVKGIRFLDSICLFMLVISIFRAYSKNIYKRKIENNSFLGLVKVPRKKYNNLVTRIKNRKVYKYMKCENCHQTLRVPRGKGKIMVTCPKCKHKMEVRS